MELHTFVRFHARQGNEEAVAQAMRDSADDVRGEEGCVFIEYHRGVRDPRMFYIHSCWKDEAAFQVHADLPHTVRFLDGVLPLLDHDLDLTRTRPFV
ncbi:MAG TPA: antibiotic biosynthesis monooxygenase [Rhizomicrobium sp.]|jgi:quinol monooxygenase YgiN